MGQQAAWEGLGVAERKSVIARRGIMRLKSLRMLVN